MPHVALRSRTERIPSIKIASYMIVVVAALVPVSIFFVIAYGQLSSVVLDNAETLARTLRDSRIERISASIHSVFGNATAAGAHALETGTLTGFNAPDTAKPLRELIVREPAIARLTLFNGFFEPLASVDSDGDVSEVDVFEAIRLTLQDLNFETPEVILELDMGDTTSTLTLFSRIATGTRILGYLTAIFDYETLDASISTPDRTRILLFNGRYQRIADSLGGSRWAVIIDPLTERMLDGFSETVRSEETIHSYGFIDLATTELFIDVIVPLSIGSRRVSSFVITFVFFLLVSALFAVVVAWSHVRSILRYGESLLIRSRFTREMEFFTGMVENLSAIQERIESAAGLQSRLDRLQTDISVIIEELPGGDSDDK